MTAKTYWKPTLAVKDLNELAFSFSKVLNFLQKYWTYKNICIKSLTNGLIWKLDKKSQNPCNII